jgi:GntR family transcriptional regulator
MNAAYTELYRRIQEGEIAPGDPLPSNKDLQKEVDLSVDDIERAVSELIYEGVLQRERPAPITTVCRPEYELWGTLTGIHSITKEAKKRGQEPGVEILSYEHTTSWPRVQRLLQLEPGDEVVLMERLRKADGEPVAIEISYYPAKLYPGISEDMFTGSGSGQSSFKVMQQEFGLISARAEDEVGVVSLEPREAGILGLAPGTPVLLRYRTTFSDKDVAIKASRAVWKFWAAYGMDL